MANLADFNEYKTYMTGIATSHVDIASAEFGTIDTMLNKGSNLQLRTLWSQPYENVRVNDPGRSDQYLGYGQCTLVVFGQASSDKFTDEQAEYNILEGIVRDIISKMLKDFQEGTININPNGFRYGEAADVLGGEKLIGCMLQFEIVRPENFVYNQAKWT